MSKILLLNGPNLNLLGHREPGHYESQDLATLVADLKSIAAARGHELKAHQSNAEAELLGMIQEAQDRRIDYLLFNPAAYTHTSVALRDGLLAVNLSFIEIHLSNIYAREAFRKLSYFSDIADGVISGLGPLGYTLALEAAMTRLEQTD